MRTTVNLDSDVVRAARGLAKARSISLGAAISELACRGLEVDPPDADGAIPVFRVPPGARPISAEDVKRGC